MIRPVRLEDTLLKKRLFRNMMTVTAIFMLVVSGCGKKADKNSADVAKEQSKTSAVSESGIEVPPMSSNGIMYGVVIDVSEKSMTVQSDLGTTVKFGLNKETDVTGVKEGIVSGAAVKIEYEGKFEGISAKKIKIKKIVDSEKLPKLDKAALGMAGSIILAIESGDQSMLARLCEYPIVFDTGKEKRIGSVQEFISLKRSDIFTKRLVNSVSRTNLFVTNAYSDGFLLGLSKPNIVVSNTKDGYLITGFHYK